MQRKHWFLISLILSLLMRLHMNLQGEVSDGLLTLPVWVLWMAFLLPVAVPVKFTELHFFLFDPWVGDGHWLLTTVAMIGCAALLWFFPWARVERWFGTFDALKDSPWFRLRKRLGLPSFWQAVAAALDKLHRLNLGKGKSGGWA